MGSRAGGARGIRAPESQSAPHVERLDAGEVAEASEGDVDVMRLEFEPKAAPTSAPRQLSSCPNQ